MFFYNTNMFSVHPDSLHIASYIHSRHVSIHNIEEISQLYGFSWQYKNSYSMIQHLITLPNYVYLAYVS